jgi:soluble P-type ATPase
MRTAIFNWLWTRKNDGSLVLRIEDTDRDRSDREFENIILKELKWLGIDVDEGPKTGGNCGPYRQSDRLDIYEKYLQKLIEEDKAYYCYCMPEELDEMRKEAQANDEMPGYNGRCRDLTEEEKRKFEEEGREPVVRFKIPLDDKEILVGSRQLMQQNEINTEDLENEMKLLEKEAKTAMLVATDNELVGIVAVADTLKDDSVKAIKELRKLGLQTAMITGDNERTAEAIAEQVGIDYVVAEVLPDGKVDEIKKLQNKFGKIAMVGDGINDAPALTQADVGMAIGTGTDIAIESSDITLVRGDLSAVITGVKLSRATFRKIKQNLFWAYIYNTVAIPVAILGLLHPVIAEIAMAGSSITVVTNANMLRRVNVKPDYVEQ